MVERGLSSALKVQVSQKVVLPHIGSKQCSLLGFLCQACHCRKSSELGTFVVKLGTCSHISVYGWTTLYVHSHTNTFNLLRKDEQPECIHLCSKQRLSLLCVVSLPSGFGTYYSYLGTWSSLCCIELQYIVSASTSYIQMLHTTFHKIDC